MFNKLRTRKGRLEHKIREELEKENPSKEVILEAVEDYQKDNLDTIEKLKREKRADLNKINGALKQTINAHGPITKTLIGSASKRVYGALMINPNERSDNRISIRQAGFWFCLGFVAMLTLILFLA